MCQIDSSINFLSKISLSGSYDTHMSLIKKEKNLCTEEESTQES